MPWRKGEGRREERERGSGGVVTAPSGSNIISKSFSHQEMFPGVSMTQGTTVTQS